MEIRKICKVNSDTLLNRGHLFELALNMDFGFIKEAGDYRRDNRKYTEGYDLPELKASAKLGNKATLCPCNDSDTLDTAIDKYLSDCIAETYIVGFEQLSEIDYTALILDKAEMRELLREFAKFDRESSKNAPKGQAPRRTLRLMLNTETKQRKAVRDREA